MTDHPFRCSDCRKVVREKRRFFSDPLGGGTGLPLCEACSRCPICSERKEDGCVPDCAELLERQQLRLRSAERERRAGTKPLRCDWCFTLRDDT